MSGTQQMDRRSILNDDRRHATKKQILSSARAFEADASRTDDAILSILQSINSPISLRVWLLWKHKEYEQLVETDVNPAQYDDRAPWAFRDDYIASNLLAKADFIPLSVSKYDAAMLKFTKFEQACGQTNRRFLNPALDPLYSGSNVWLLNAVKRKIARILGPFDPEEWVDSCNWGPGSTTLLKGAHVSGANKFDTDNGITSELSAFIRPWFRDVYPRWSEHLTERSEDQFAIQAGNSIVTVPKNSKTDRVIAIEPAVNQWFQKGIGSMIRRRLARWGTDLNDQSINQRLSYRASIIPEWENGALSTIDFSSASDSISLEVVRELIPYEWLQVLEVTRCPFGTLDNQPLRWNKFSSMGNGYTFELESLIFYAAALSVQELERHDGEVSVYGDDVILPTRCVDTFHSFCTFLGFTVNNEKSFSSTAFRESCGTHYFSGLDVKPIYLKGRLSSILSIYKLANSVRLLAHRCNSYRSCDRRFLNCFARFHRWVPKSLRLKVPPGYGDTGFVSNFDEACPSRARDGFEGFRTRALVEIGVSQSDESEGMFLYRLKVASSAPPNKLEGRVSPDQLRYQLSRRVSSYRDLPTDLLWSDGCYTLRKKTRRKVVTLLVSQWMNLGPWD